MYKKQKETHIHNELTKLLSTLRSRADCGTELSTVERLVFGSLIKLGQLLLCYYISEVSRRIQAQVSGSVKALGYRNKGKKARSYFSIFGQVSIHRTRYYHREVGQVFFVDAALGLPQDKYSYVLKDWLGGSGVEVNYEESVSQLNRIFDYGLHPMVCHRICEELSGSVGAYYDQVDWSNVDVEESSCLCLSCDGKGVPIVRKQRNGARSSSAVRLSWGQKKRVKKEATVSVSYSFAPRPRSPDQIVKGLFAQYSVQEQAQYHQQKQAWAQQKHRRAFLSDIPQAIGYGLDNLLARDPRGKKPIIVLLDGDRALEKEVQRALHKRGIAHRLDALILDIMHLMEYVWKVANAHLGGTNPERIPWVEKQVKLLLNSQSDQVIAQWKEIQKAPKSKVGHYHLERALTYIHNHRHMIDYRTYLKKGYPIATGIVEATCGHLVKARMEQNGMHWSTTGAQNMLHLRAVKKNLDWEQFFQFFLKNQQKELYPFLSNTQPNIAA